MGSMSASNVLMYDTFTLRV